MTKIVFTVLVLLMAGRVTHAQSALVAHVLEQLRLKTEDCSETLIVEKPLPDNSGRFIIVIPKMADSNDVYFALDSYILLVDRSGKIISRYFEDHTTNGWESDAVRLDNISIDTAPYLVKPGVRAFGVTVSYIGSSHANPYSSNKLWLFIQDGQQLKCILSQFEINRYNGEWDTRCAGTSIQEEKIIGMAHTSTNGYFDLLVTSKMTHSTTIEVGDDCKEHSRHSIKRTVLKFLKDGYR